MDIRKNFLDRAKCYGMVFVILGHIILISPLDINNYFLAKFTSDIIYSFHMQLFFLISGSILLLKFEKYEKNATLYIKNRIYRFFIPFISVNLLYTIAIYLYMYSFNNNILWSSGDKKFPIDIYFLGGTWFIAGLLISYLLVFFILNIKWFNDFLPNYNFYAYVVLLFMGYNLINDKIILGDIFPFSYGISKYIFWFVLGGILVPSLENIIKYIKKYNTIHNISIFFILLIYYELWNIALKTTFVFPIATIIVVLIISHFQIPRFDPLIIELGKMGMRMYIIHFFVLDFVWQPVFINLFMNTQIANSYYYFPVAFLFVYSISAIIALKIRNNFIEILIFGEKKLDVKN